MAVSAVMENDGWPIAEIAGEPEVGLGHSALGALDAALSSLGVAAVQALMADPQPLAVSRRLRRPI
jgi:hypothetical protein